MVYWDRLEESKMEQKEMDLFEKNKGRILGLALNVESELEFFISNYLVKPQNDKTFFFNDILSEMNFEQKIELFKKICVREKFNQKEISEICKSIKFIQELRNKVAHWQSEISFDSSTKSQFIQLRKRKSITTSKDIIKLTDEIIKQTEEEMQKATEGIMKFYLKYYKEGTIDEKPVSWGI